MFLYKQINIKAEKFCKNQFKIMQPMKISYAHFIDYANNKLELLEYKNIDVSSESKDNLFAHLLSLIVGKQQTLNYLLII